MEMAPDETNDARFARARPLGLLTSAQTFVVVGSLKVLFSGRSPPQPLL